MVNIEISEEQKILMENDACYREAANLAIFLVKKHYSENPTFSLCDSTQGIISQIANMVCQLVRV
jgi:hypothetical protein